MTQSQNNDKSGEAVLKTVFLVVLAGVIAYGVTVIGFVLTQSVH